MVNIKDVRVSNARFKESTQSLVAVFVGATSGIGLATLKHFAQNAYKPTIYIIGRSKSSSATILSDLNAANSGAAFNFIETEISLIKNVDQACKEITSKEKKVDLLFMSPGYTSLGGRDESTEGIDIPLALRYYSRLRFTYNLLPLLNASTSPKVVAILAGGKEGPIDVNDLEMKTNFNAITAVGVGATQTTLAFEELAKSNPNIAFIHKFPGFVGTTNIDRMLGSTKGLLAIPATIAIWLLLPVLKLFSTSPDVAGERGLFIATSSRYPPAQSKTSAAGVALPEGVEIAQSTVMTDGSGNGVYTLDENDEPTPDALVMPDYRLDGTGKTIWEKTQAVWDRAISRA